MMMDDVNGACEPVYAGFEQEGDQSNDFKATLLRTACDVHWMTADLLDRLQAFFQAIHTTRFLIETLALQAMLYHAEGDEPVLGRAQPSGKTLPQSEAVERLGDGQSQTLLGIPEPNASGSLLIADTGEKEG
jgi:hypothetical protein